MRSTILLIAFLFFCPDALGQACHYSSVSNVYQPHARVVSHHNNYSYQTYNAHAAHHAYSHAQNYDVVTVKEYKDVVLVPLVKKIEVSPEYFFSVRDYYKDALMLELFQMRKDYERGRAAPLTAPSTAPSGIAQAPVQPAQPPPSSPPAGTIGHIDSKLSAVIQANCVICHGGEKGVRGNLSFANMDKITFEQWKACYNSVLTGTMPKGTAPLSDFDQDLFLDRLAAVKAAQRR